MPAQLHAHAALDVPGGVLHPNNIGHNAEALIKVHVGNGVGPQFGKGRMTALHDDGEGVHGSCTLRHTPGEVTRAALGAMATGIEDHGVACITRLIAQLVPFCGLPERLRVRFREARLGSWCCHGLVSPSLSACDRWAQSVAKIVTAVAWREPSWPPLPTATASMASLTWDVDSPRSCRVASSSKKRPRCPGWFDDRPPPSVFNAGLRGSSKTRWPSLTNCPPSPFLQNPRSSMRHMTVMENES